MSALIPTDRNTLIELLDRAQLDVLLANRQTVIELLPAMRGPRGEKGEPGEKFDPTNTPTETDFELVFKLHLEI